MLFSKSKLYEGRLIKEIDCKHVQSFCTKRLHLQPYTKRKNTKVITYELNKEYVCIDDLFSLACMYSELDLIEFCLCFDLNKNFILSCVKLCKNWKIQKYVFDNSLEDVVEHIQSWIGIPHQSRTFFLNPTKFFEE